MCKIKKIQLDSEPDWDSLTGGAALSLDGSEVYWLDYDNFPFRLMATNTTTFAESVFATGDGSANAGSLEVLIDGAIEVGPDGSLYTLEFEGLDNFIVRYTRDGVGPDDSLALPTGLGSAMTANRTHAKMAYIPGLDKMAVGRYTLGGGNTEVEFFLKDLDLLDSSGAGSILKYIVPSVSVLTASCLVIRSSGNAFWAIYSDGHYTRIDYYDGGVVSTLTSTGSDLLLSNFTAWSPCDGSGVIMEQAVGSSKYTGRLVKVGRDLSIEEVPESDPCYLLNGIQICTPSLAVRGIGGSAYWLGNGIDYGATHGELARWLTFQCAVPVTGLRQKQRDDRLNTPRARGQHNGPSSRQYSPRSSSLNSYR